MRAFVKQIEWFIDKLGFLGSMAIIVVALLSVVEIFRRYVLVAPSIWATDLIVAIAAATYVLAGPYALHKHSHIEITVFSDHFPRWLKVISEILKPICGLIYIGALLYGSFDMARAAISGGETLGGAWDVPIPQVTKSILFISTALFLALLIGNLVQTLHKIATGAPFDSTVQPDSISTGITKDE